MALSVHAGYDFAEIGDFYLEVTDTGTSQILGDENGITRTNGEVGSGDDVVQSATTTWCNVDISSIVSGYDDFATILGSALTDDTVLTRTYSVSFSKTTGFYTISANGSFSITTNTTALARNILGIATSGAVSSSGNAITSTRQAYYSKIGAMGARSDDTGQYEPDDLCDDAEDDAGASYGMSVTTPPKYRDWVLAFETEAATFKHKAADTVPWTWEHFFEHVRVDNPFGIMDDGQDAACFMRGNAGSFKPRSVALDWHAYWNIPFGVRVKGNTTAGTFG